MSASGLVGRNCARARCQHPDESALIERWVRDAAGAVRGWRWAQGARFLVPSAVPIGEELSQRVKRANFEQRGGASLHRDRHTCVGRAAHSKMRARYQSRVSEIAAAPRSASSAARTLLAQLLSARICCTDHPPDATVRPRAPRLLGDRTRRRAPPAPRDQPFSHVGPRPRASWPCSRTGASSVMHFRYK